MKSNMKGVLITVAFGGMLSIAGAQDQQTGGQEPDLLLPEDLTFNQGSQTSQTSQQDQQGFLFYEEIRVGGRLERVTVKRDGGFTEIYKNNRDDTLWDGAEGELGEGRNQRQWKIGSW
jgi:hypothetical protein